MIKLNNISLYFAGNDNYILKNINWNIKDNEKWILFGRNGSGKTKLLEIITGYLYPSSGEIIRFNNESVSNDIRDIRKRIGYISTSIKDKFSINERIIDIVLSGLYASIGLYDTPNNKDIMYAHELLSTINMNERAYEKFSILSDGEKQKILMLRAFINQPDLLIFDEASKGLDISAREDLLESIEKLTKLKEISLVYVTHHTEEITQFFDKIFIINKGECFFCGNIKEGINNTILSKIFNKNIKIKEFNNRYYSMLD